MLQAHLVATRSTCDRGPELFFDKGRHGVGAVIVKDRMIIGTGYNGSPPGAPHCSDPEEFFHCLLCGDEFMKEGVDSKCDLYCPTCLCNEIVKIHGGHIISDGHCVRTIHSEMNALLQCSMSGTSPVGAEIFTTASPCYDCAKAIIRAGIVGVRFSAAYNSRYGLSGQVKDLLADSNVEYSMIHVKLEV
jgi:dCMP deaminase